MQVSELIAAVSEFDGLTVVEYVESWFDSDDLGNMFIESQE